MRKSIDVIPKTKRGRPATGRDPLVAMRLPIKLIEALNKRAAAEGTNRSETIRRLIEQGLSVPASRKAKHVDPANRADWHSKAERAAHDYIDNALKHEPEHVRTARKKRLTTMPGGVKRR